MKTTQRPFFVTIPHSGETVPGEVTWLQGLAEPVLMRDVDRYVDQLYQPAIDRLQISAIISSCHRYVIDLNRLPEEFDAQAVVGAPFPAGSYPKGLHWAITTLGEVLIPAPMSMELHHELVQKYYAPFHKKVGELAEAIRRQAPEVYHLDLHSMPSMGTALHNDPGQRRADIVVSDFHGKSSRSDFVELIKAAYEAEGFSIAYNWPYFGGGITQMYGHPVKKHHTVQVELNRALYMDETTKAKASGFVDTQQRLGRALEKIYSSF